MGQLIYTFVYGKGSEILLSPDEFRSLFSFGLTFKDPMTGRTLDNNTVKFYLQSAKEQVEQYLGIKLCRQVYDERLNYSIDDWSRWGYIRTSYPVVEPIGLEGWMGTQKQLSYPVEWMIVKNSTVDDRMVTRNIYLIPSNNSTVSSNSVYFALTARVGFPSREIPYYWHVQYLTGFSKIPKDILSLIAKLTSIDVLALIGDIILGPGVSSRSIGLDGLSQSISIANPAFKTRIDGYIRDIQTDKDRLRDQYNPISFTTC